MGIDTSPNKEAKSFPGEMTSSSEIQTNVTTSGEIVKDRKSFFYRRRKRELIAITIALLSYVAYTLFKPDASPVVQTNTGKLVGTVGKSRIGREYYEYVGIPYGQPPVGDLRFEVRPHAIIQQDFKRVKVN